MLLFTQSRKAGSASITKLRWNKDHHKDKDHLRDHENNATDIAVDTSSQVINNIRTFFNRPWISFLSRYSKIFSQVTANSSAWNRPVLVFLSWFSENIITWLLMVTRRKSGSGDLLENLILLMNFFLKSFSVKFRAWESNWFFPSFGCST